MKTELIPELFSTPLRTFEEHLNLPYNERILFSGIYGIGKSTFLRHFFKLEENKEKYNVIHLYPVNYSVLENEDVFTYIKYDILYELIIEHKFEFTEEHFTFLETLPFFLQSNAYQIFSAFLLTIRKLGKQLFQFSQELEKLHFQFKQLQSGGEQAEDKVLNKFLQSFQDREGLYESNIITQLIIQALGQLSIREVEKEKKNILIIDDLDRLDPHHIFRLFNIFAAHFDHRNKGELVNKFGFNQVVFVCDLDNIRGIFKSNYGASVDFNGYIDKFYSQKVFKYNNSASLINTVAKVIHNGLLSDSYDNLESANVVGWYAEITDRDLRYILEQLINTNLLNLRVLLKFFSKKSRSPAKKKPLIFTQQKRFLNISFRSVVIVDLLMELFGNYEYLLEVIEKCGKQIELTQVPEFYDTMVCDVCLILDYKIHGFKNELIGNEVRPTVHDLANARINYNYRQAQKKYFTIFHGYTSLDGRTMSSLNVNYFTLFRELLLFLNSIGYLKNI